MNKKEAQAIVDGLDSRHEPLQGLLTDIVAKVYDAPKKNPPKPKAANPKPATASPTT